MSSSDPAKTSSVRANWPPCASIDNSFGPHAKHCRSSFDFTLFFEETILSIAPLAFLLVLATFRIAYLSRKRTKVVYSSLLPLKLLVLLLYAATQLALVVFWARPSTVKTRGSIPTAIFSLLGSFVFILLSYVEHKRAVRPSLIFNVYLLFSLLFDIARARTLWLIRYDRAITAVFTTGVATKAIMLLLEALEKRGILRPEYRDYPPEATAGPFSRSFFWWLNELFMMGYRKLLFLDDLFSLDKHLASDHLQHLFQSAWGKANRKGTHALFIVAVKVLKWPLLSVVLPRLCLIAFNFSQPFLITRAIQYSVEPKSPETHNHGYGLIGAYVIVYIGIAVSTGQHQHLTYRAITMARGGLVSMLYAKTTDLSITAVDPAASLTLMSADIERITTGWQVMHEIWANMIEIALAIYLLQRQLGAACVIPIGVAVVSMAGSVGATGLIMSRQKMWLEAIEKRIAATTAMLGSMKGVKMCGLTDILATNLQALRVEELRISKKFRKLLIWNMGFAFITPVLAPVLTFAVFSALVRNRTDITLDTARVFTALALFTLLAEPLSSLIMALAMFMGSIGCFDRIQEFLNTEVRRDGRRMPAPLLLEDDRSLSSNEKSISDIRGSTVTLELIQALMKAEHDRFSGGDVVTVENGSFGWDPEKEPLLRGINLNVPSAKLTMIVGPVGCGKSTLLKALLGEVPTMSGSIYVASPEIAFCDQTPWHMNGTIQSSILGLADFDSQWYASVIHACALEEDLRRLPRGDLTLIGSKGIALSGGQSQRIALARAVYSRKNIVFLDDVLSGLDADTENQVFHSLLGRKGLWRRHGTTVLVASSAASRLPFADHIVTLDKDGVIVEQGTFDELNRTGGYVASFNLRAPDWAFEPEMVPATKYVYSPVTTQATEAIEAEASRRTGDVSIYMYYVRSVGWIPTIIFMVAMTAFVFCVSFPSVWVKWWAAANAERPNQNLGYYLGIYAMLGGLAIFCLVLSCWQMIITMVPKSGEYFHWTLLKSVLSAPMSFFATTDTGVTLNRFSQDLQLIDMELPVAALNAFSTLLLCIAQMALIGVASKYAAAAFPLTILSLYLVQKFYLRTSRQLRFMDIEAKSPLYSQFVECLSGLATVRAFGWQKALEKINRDLLDRSQRPFYLLFAVQRWLTLVLELIVAAIAVLLIILVVTLRGTLSAGYVGIALLNVITFSQTIKLLVMFWTQLETHIGAIARIKIFAAGAVSEDLPTETNNPPHQWPAKGAIEIKSLSGGYKPNELVLKNVSLSIEAGQKIGVCGRTGSGKSSLILSIFRMMEISEGSIKVDGVDISTIPRQEIRSKIVGVPQDAYLLNGSVRLNADPSECFSDEAIIEALKSVQLWKTIEEKGGLDVDIDEIHLSHGQRQLFCLARAILRPSTILILDEATSSVDGKTDQLMQRVIRQKFSGHTIIAVAHKLETILDFDKVAVLDEGSLVEFDSPDALLSNPSSAFSKLYNHHHSRTEQIEIITSDESNE